MPDTPLLSPIALSEAQMSALLAASHPLPPDCRSAFLEHCARELAQLPMVGDGAVHRVIMRCGPRIAGVRLTRSHRRRHVQ
jgi:hypothetical protein